MASPILRLHGEVWSQVLDFLVSESTVRLMMTGNPRLYGLLQRSTTTLDIQSKKPYVDLEQGIRAASQFPQLTSLSILGLDSGIMARLPSSTLNFAPQLTSLSLSFQNCFAFISLFGGPLASLINLKALKLEGQVSEPIDELLGMRFPPNLTSLELDASAFSVQRNNEYPAAITIADWTKLPSQLVTLSLRGVTPKDPMIGQLPRSLTSFTANTGIWRYTDFPRSMKKISLSRNATIPTEFRNTFPWRACFPLLEYLTVQSLNSYDTLLDSIVIADPHSPIERHIAENPLPSAPSHPYTSEGTQQPYETQYKVLNILATHSAHNEYAALMKRFSSLQTLQTFNLSPTVLEYTKGLTSLECIDLRLPGDVSLPPTLTHIRINYVDIKSIPAGTRLLHIAELGMPDQDGTNLADRPLQFPAKCLTSFSLTGRPLGLPLAQALPSTISHLEVHFKGKNTETTSQFDLKRVQKADCEKTMNECDLAWRALIPRLASLKSLVLNVRGAFPTMALTPIVSQDFESLKIMRSTPASLLFPWYCALFDGPEYSGLPRILPSSIRKISICTYGDAFPLKLLAVLPRSLTHFDALDLSPLESPTKLQEDPDIPHVIPDDAGVAAHIFGLVSDAVSWAVNLANSPYPYFRHVSPTQAFAGLPRGLLYFICGHGTGGNQFKVDPAAILALPQSIVSLRLPEGLHIFEPGASTDIPRNQAVLLMPPNLSNLEYYTSNGLIMMRRSTHTSCAEFFDDYMALDSKQTIGTRDNLRKLTK